MGKRKDSADTAAKTQTKKSKSVSTGGKTTARKGAGDAIPDKEMQGKMKVNPKPCSSSKLPGGIPPDDSTSKYFKSPLKEEPETDDDDDNFIMPMAMPAAAAATLKPVKKEEEEEEEEGSEESEEDDWEEVEELAEPLAPVAEPEPTLPSQPVEIEIETPDAMRRRKKRERRKAEFEAYLRRMVNRFNKDLLLDTHKVHLMCLIANGMVRNRLCTEPDLLAITLSLLPTHFTVVAKERIDQNYLSGLLRWFGDTFSLNPSLPYEERPDPRALLERRLASLSARDHREMTHLFLLVLRSLQLFCRLVLSLQPVSLKLPSAKGRAAAKTSGGKNPPTNKMSPEDNPPSQPKVSPGSKRPPAGGRTKGERGGKRAKKKGMKEEEEEEEEEDEEEEEEKKKKQHSTAERQKPKNTKRRSVASKVSYKEASSSEGEGLGEGVELSDDDDEEEEFKLAGEEGESDDSEEESGRKGQREKRTSRKTGAENSRGTAAKRKSTGGKKKKKNAGEEHNDDQECVKTEGAEVGETGKGAKRVSRRKSEGAGADEWLEVYLAKTASWVCVDVERGVGQPQLCAQNATAPLTYVVSVDGDGHLKDLGRKYDPTWMTSSRKRRVDEDWWEDTLEPFLGPEDERDAQEEKELQAKLLDKPMPTSVGEYKNHPLYALRRHLLKYEAIYPETAAVLGYCRGEPVYSRDCVHTLHSRDTWLKEARTVRLGEAPFKMVRGFSNRSRKARMISEQTDANDLPLFGEWQTEEYQPPLALDGKVPRNEYGNVYLFKPCMLPVGCAHVRLPNLNRVARKLGIDAASAVTGFDFHGGYSHAVTDGYVVCEEHEEVLRAAWVEDQDIQKQKEKEKREKRAVSNWALLVKSLLIRERLKMRYGKKPGPGGAGASSHPHNQDGEEAVGLSSDEEEVGHEDKVEKTAAETLAMSWPQNRQDEEGQDERKASAVKKKMTKRERRGQEKHLFPFEKI